MKYKVTIPMVSFVEADNEDHAIVQATTGDWFAEFLKEKYHLLQLSETVVENLELKDEEETN